MEEMAAMIKQTANSAQETQRGASEAKSRATDGKRSVDELVSAMREISSTNDKLGGLDKVITDIEAKTRIINDIAFETKLLAFNASIEAARAGAHGRGFAVVSDEVGKLAATSNKAADEVRELLESSHAAVDAIISETRTKVEHGQTKTKLCADAFSAMENSLVAIADSVNEIANAAKEQMSGVSQTNSAMQEMEKATRQNAASSEFLARLASDLFTRSKKFESASLDLRRAVLGNARGSSLQQGEALVDTTAATNNGVKADTNQSAQDLRPAPGSNTETPLKIVKGENAESAAEIDRDDSRWKAA
jgi:methyl-accepting chemotaxis protein